jgi:hypothetical protein
MLARATWPPRVRCGRTGSGSVDRSGSADSPWRVRLLSARGHGYPLGLVSVSLAQRARAVAGGPARYSVLAATRC